MTPKTTLLVLLTAGSCWLTLTSNSNGPGISGQGDRSSTGCGGSGCHAANTAATSVTLTLTGPGGAQVTNGEYIPGTVYTVTLTGINSSSSSLTAFGFQTTARRANGQNAGTLAATSSTTHTYTASGRTGVEHGPKIFASGPNYQVSFQWTAPAAGVGPVTFFSAVNVVNNDNNISGDQPNIGNTTFQEGAASSVPDVDAPTPLALYPNPATDHFLFDTRGWAVGDYSVSVFSSTGPLVSQHSVTHSGADRAEVRLPDLSTGLYAVRVQGEGRAQSAPLFIR